MDVSRLINLGWCASTPLTDGLKTAYADVVGKQRAYCGFINSEQPTLNKWGLPDRRFETAQPSCKVQGIKSRYLKKHGVPGLLFYRIDQRVACLSLRSRSTPLAQKALKSLE